MVCGGNPSSHFPRLPELRALAGPVVAAACFVPPDTDVPGIQDSKQVPTQTRVLGCVKLLLGYYYDGCWRFFFLVFFA